MSRYDVEKFTPPPDPDLVCCICQCVLDGPVESPCRHVFCKVCIETWLRNNRNCPNCRRRLRKSDLQPVLPLVQNMLNRLQMFCDFKANGCTQIMSLEMYDRHTKDCEYELLKCKYEKCSQSMLRRDIKKHEEELCDHREKLCSGQCGLMIPISIFDSHNCVEELHKFVSERESLVERMNQKIVELSNLTERLNQQIEELRQEMRSRSHYYSDWDSMSDNETSSTYYSGDDMYSDYNSNDNSGNNHSGRDGGVMTFEEFDREDRNFWRNLRFRRTDYDDNGNYDHSPRSRRRRYLLRGTSEQSAAEDDGNISEVDVVNTPPRSPSDYDRGRSRTPTSVRSRSNSSSSSRSRSNSSFRSRYSTSSNGDNYSLPPPSPWERDSYPCSPFSSRRSDSNDSKNSDSNDSRQSFDSNSVVSDTSSMTNHSRQSQRSNHSSSSHSSTRRSWMEGRNLTPAIRGHYTFDSHNSPSSHGSTYSQNEDSDTDSRSNDSVSSRSTVVEQPRSRSSSLYSSHSESSRTYDYKRQHSTSCGVSGVGSDEDSRHTEDRGSSPHSHTAFHSDSDDHHSDTDNGPHQEDLACSPRSDSTVLDYMDSPTSQDADPAHIKSDLFEPGRFRYNSGDSISDKHGYHQDSDSTSGHSDVSRAESGRSRAELGRQDPGSYSSQEENYSDEEGNNKEECVTPTRKTIYDESGYSDASERESVQDSTEITPTESETAHHTLQGFNSKDTESQNNNVNHTGQSAEYEGKDTSKSAANYALPSERLTDQGTDLRGMRQTRKTSSTKTSSTESADPACAESCSKGESDEATSSVRKRKRKKEKSALNINKFLKHEKVKHDGTVGVVSLEYCNSKNVVGSSQNDSGFVGCTSIETQNTCDSNILVRKRKRVRPIQSDSSDNEAIEGSKLVKQAKCSNQQPDESVEKEKDVTETSAIDNTADTGVSCRKEGVSQSVVQDSQVDSAVGECESDSDNTWEPDPTECLSDDSDLLSDWDLDEGSDYEVEIPKSVVDILNEYCSEDSDEDWHP